MLQVESFSFLLARLNSYKRKGALLKPQVGSEEKSLTAENPTKEHYFV
jgi:hypothetical protein